jgi:hypothetical protein
LIDPAVPRESERRTMTTGEFERMLSELLGGAAFARVTSTTLARAGHDLLAIIVETQAYQRLSALQQRFQVEITFAEPNSREFILSIRKL